MVKVTVGKAEDPWCEIELTEEDVEDWKKGVDITEEKLKEVIQLPPITLDNCHEREDGDLQWLSLTVRWDEITFEEEVNGKYWHAVIMALHRIREDFVKKQWRKMKHLDWYMTMKKTSDKRNAKYYAACLEGLSQHCGDSRRNMESSFLWSELLRTAFPRTRWVPTSVKASFVL
ncbi:hypothetical protein AK812_SmicGene4503 [Symbiodinium microadriaticum]|uniref:Uncharacterized protein n=1 Tax=Symbiodinium microadriaticum TaxID=2951 RepID=A0A1Q9EW76_SYMMI|nr:hypothetical protein AK812_SmicGene4503 [Symbiodinium microadriaticum]